jgi:signal transduction histidine kinase
MPRTAPFEPPPLKRWGTTWRYLLAVFVGLLSWTVTVPGADAYTTRHFVMIPVDLALGIVAIVLMRWRRRAPLRTALTVSLISGFSTMSIGAVSIVVISVATRRRWREVVTVGVVWIGAGFAYEYLYPGVDPTSWWALLLVGALVYVVCVAIGFYIGGRREILGTLKARAETAEREQAARVDNARTAERSRIAREMHDVLAHRISLVAMHSGALAYRDDLTREETAQTATIIRDNAHLALAELREVLGVLRDPGGILSDVPDRPQPTLAALPELVEETVASGTPVECDVPDATADQLGSLPDTTSRNAYRILQEALTNARKHAPGIQVRVAISGEPGDRLTLAVHNPLPLSRGVEDPLALPSSGMGLTGLAERAKLAGGELTHGVDRGGQFAVRAWLPWPT